MKYIWLLVSNSHTSLLYSNTSRPIAFVSLLEISVLARLSKTQLTDPTDALNNNHVWKLSLAYQEYTSIPPIQNSCYPNPKHKQM